MIPPPAFIRLQPARFALLYWQKNVAPFLHRQVTGNLYQVLDGALMEQSISTGIATW